MKLNREMAFVARSMLLFLLGSHFAFAEEKLRIGVLKFGTVNWELSVIKERELDKKHGFDLEIVPLAAKNATHVSIQGGAVDMIVSDWIWVSRQRSDDRRYTFAPYSTAAGAVMVRPDSGIEQVSDLEGKKIGVAGGSIDKSWLLFSAFTRQTQGRAIESMASPSYAAPPLINELIQSGEFSAALNYWHYTARLKALGMRELIKVKDMLPVLGIEREIPLIGWVFDESWAKQRPQLVAGFLAASKEAQQLMKTEDSLWNSIRPMMKVDSQEMAVTLRDAFREGIISCFNRDSVDAIEAAFAILARLGGSKLVGKSSELATGTIWAPAIDAHCR